MASAEDVLVIARSQLGTEEKPPGSNKVKYSTWYGVNGPWCAMFVSWVFHEAGLPLPASTKRGFAYTPSGAQWFQRRSAWFPKGEALPGDVVFFNFPGDGVDRISHVGIVEARQKDDTLICLEGNTNERGGRTGGKVMRKARAVGIVGCGRPDFGTGAKPVKFNPPEKMVEIPGDPMKLPVLKQGHTGHYVSILQGLLLVHAQDIVAYVNGSHKDLQKTIDGQFGKKTKEALKAWQEKTTLEADGECGPKTWAWLMGVT